MKIALLLAVLSVSSIGRAGVNEAAAPQGALSPVAVNVWAACAHNFLASNKPEAFADQLGGMLASLNNVDLHDAAAVKSLEPLAAQLREGSQGLLAAQITVGPDPLLAAKTLKLRALAETPLGALIYPNDRWRAEGLYQAYHERLSAQERGELDDKMKPIAAALTVTAAPREADGVEASAYVAEVHKSGLSPSGVTAIAKVQTYFKEKGIPVTEIRYHEGYDSPGMGMMDPGSWTPANLTVSFADATTYNSWKSKLPSRIGGIDVYADSAQASQAQVHADVAREQSLLVRAADHFQAQGLPVSSIRNDGGGLTVSFPNTRTYRDWKDLIPKRFADALIYADPKHVSESDAIDAAAAHAALMARAKTFFSDRGYAVKAITYNEGYYSEGMSPYDGGSWTSPTLSVTFADAQNLTRWNKRWLFHSAAGISVLATADPGPGLAFPDPKSHYAAALAAAQGPDAEFVSASANLNNDSRNWSFVFAAHGKGQSTVVTDALGHAALVEQGSTLSRIVHPIDINRIVSLQRAYDAAKSESLTPVFVSLERDLLLGHAQYRFSSEDGKTKVRVDATSGEVVLTLRAKAAE